MSREKRAASSSFGTTQLVKRPRSSGELNGGALVKVVGSDNTALIQSKIGAAGLKAPLMELNGHTAEVFCARFSPDGSHIASAGMDRNILLWNARGDCANYGMLSGHKNAILDLHWSRDGQTIYSASADTHISSWNAETGERTRKHAGHEGIVNCIDLRKRGEDVFASGADDNYIGIWDARAKAARDFIDTSLPVTAVCFDESGNELYSGGVDNQIKAWDLRMKQVVYTLEGHTDTVTSLVLSPDSQSLLSYSLDSTARTWDTRPFASAQRALKVLDGSQAGLEKNLIRASWDDRGRRAAVGGGDGSVTVWDSESGKMLQKLPGHKGTVNDVRISPDGSLDRTMLLGELPS